MQNNLEDAFDVAAEHRYRRGYYHGMSQLFTLLEPNLSLDQSNTLKLWLTTALSPWAHKVRGSEPPPQLPAL